MPINLSASPFENLRPINRIKWLLLVLGIVVWGITTIKYWDYAAGSSEETRSRLHAVEAEISALNRSLTEAENTLRQADLEARNERMAFLNAKLGERAFPWSQLFQDLGQAQPYRVRLHGVRPKIEQDEDSGLPGYALLSLEGSAQNRTAWYRFVDRLFEHPRFESPQMISEDPRDGQVEFRLQVLYRIGMEAAAESEAAESWESNELTTDAPENMSAAR